jgi:hypothetical protein
MSTTLLEEAIIDAQKLRELAEQTAKNKIIEAVMPQIRAMVNKKILGESTSEDDTVEETDSLKLEQNENDRIKEPDSSRNEDCDEDDEDCNDDDEKNLVESLLSFIGSQSNVDRMNNELSLIEKSINNLKAIDRTDSKIFHSYPGNSARKFVLVTKRALDLKESLEKENSNLINDKGLRKRLDESLKELKTMVRKNRSIFDFLFEENGSKRLSEANLSLGLSEEEREELGDDAMDKLESVLADAGITLEMDEDMDMDLDMEDEDMDMDFDMEGDDGDMGEDLDMDMDVDMDDDGEDDLEESDSLYELDESMIRREIKRLNKLSEAAADAADQFGGGTAKGDVIVDISEEDLINVLADELGKYRHDVPMPKTSSIRESRRGAKRTATSTDSRQLQRLKESYRAARGEALNNKKVAEKYRKQLQEMNLFNAKLLYANKLLQNSNFSEKQQRTIVEAIDNAKNIREVKLLFEGLSETLARKQSGKSNLNENAKALLGSSSRATKSAAPAGTDLNAERWAILAGIRKG